MWYRIIAHSTPLNRRPVYFAIYGGIECAALAFGPLISGSIARAVTWRVCFYIVVPLAVMDVLIMLFGIKRLGQPEHPQIDKKAKIELIDWGGLATQLPMTVRLILALQWAGTQYAWGNWRIVLLLVVAGLLTTAFFFIEHKTGENAMVPLRMLRRRTVAFASLVTFCNFAALWAVSFYVRIFDHVNMQHC